jgi:diguanylate cyclase (GGDEF)-like protein/PAS domain S-box-containing protein
MVLFDADGAVRYANPASKDVWKRDLEGASARKVVRLIHPEDRTRVGRLFLSCSKGSDRVVRAEFRLSDGAGEWIVLEGVATNRLDDLTVRGVIANFRDTTDRKRTELALQSSERRYALAARMASDGLWEWDRGNDRLYVSPRWKEMLGYEEEEIGNSSAEWLDRVHPSDANSVRARLKVLETGPHQHFEFVHRLKHKSLGYRWMRCRGMVVRDDDGKPIRIAGSLSDITDHKAAEDRLKYEATHDPLTGLPNRARFMGELTRTLARARRDPAFEFAVLYIDLDRFKVVNDSLGHLIGDQLLVAFAGRLRGCIRPSDSVARLGGDEFAVLLPGVRTPEEATIIADRIYRVLARPVELQGRDVFASASVGIVASSSGYEDATSILRDSDAAMYSAKAQGRSRYVMFDSAMHDKALALLELETDLRRALDEEEFVLHYQPIVDLRSDCISGFEALVRWEHPRRGLLSPIKFIPLAEETGLIVRLGEWVLAESCRQMVEWKQSLPSPPKHLSVNISARQFAQPNLVADVERILAETGAKPEWLIFEITESAIMADMDAALGVLEELRERGIRIHIDDFGSGYSALSYLYRFPIDTLKIDRLFVGSIDVEHRQSAIVQAIVSLAQHLDIDVIAEGVDSESQLTLLRDMSCPQAQGYYFSRPVDAEQAAALLIGGGGIVGADDQSVDPAA